MKAILLVITFFLMASAYGQMDVVVLKNGSELRGVIIEKTDVSVKLRSKDGSIWVFKNEEIETIKPFRPVVAESGYYGIISLGVLGGSAVSANMTFVNGYRISKHWSAGLGLGVENFYDRAYMPVFLEGRYDLLKKSSTPFAQLGFGYDFPFDMDDRNRGGFFGQGLLGFKHELGQHFGIVTGLGFRFGQLEVDNWNWWGDISNPQKTIYQINRFDLRFGFIFK
ncbi:MAG: hypothetical protein AB8B74_04420 [Crocinitomicaceae bacterium]